MSAIQFLREWWLIPLAFSFWKLGQALINVAVIRDFAIVETTTAMHGRWLMAGGHVIMAMALLAPVVPIEWGDDQVRVALLGGLLIGLAIHDLGESAIVSRRILDRWHRVPYKGDERRRQERRHRWGGTSDDRDPRELEERRGDRRGGPRRCERGGPIEVWFPDGPSKWPDLPDVRNPSAEQRKG